MNKYNLLYTEKDRRLGNLRILIANTQNLVFDLNNLKVRMFELKADNPSLHFILENRVTDILNNINSLNNNGVLRE